VHACLYTIWTCAYCFGRLIEPIEEFIAIFEYVVKKRQKLLPLYWEVQHFKRVFYCVSLLCTFRSPDTNDDVSYCHHFASVIDVVFTV
jgi:hypothetical protein